MTIESIINQYKLLLLISLFMSCKPNPNLTLSPSKEVKTDSSNYEIVEILENELESQDSILVKLINKTKLSYVEIDFKDSLKINWSVVDSLLDEQRMMCCDGNVFYSPDSLFRIYVVSSQDCGAYCNPFWESYIYAKNNRELLTNAGKNFTNVVDIFKLSDGKYLILQQEGGRPASVLTIDCRKAILVSLKKDSLISHPLLRNIEDESFLKDFSIEGNYISFCQESSVPSEAPSINYDPITKQLTYRFGRSYLYYDHVDTDSLINGVLKYENGDFKILKHNIKFINSED